MGAVWVRCVAGVGGLAAMLATTGEAAAQTYQECIQWCPSCHEFCMDHTQGEGAAARLDECAESMCPTRSKECLETHCAAHMPYSNAPAPPVCESVYICLRSCGDDAACADDCIREAPHFGGAARRLLACARGTTCLDNECLYEKCPAEAEGCDLWVEDVYENQPYLGAHVWAAASTYSMSGWGARVGMMGESVELFAEFGMGSFDGELDEVEHEGKLTRALLYGYSASCFDLFCARLGFGIGLEWLHHMRERVLEQDAVFENRDGAIALPVRVPAGVLLPIAQTVIISADVLAGQHFVLSGDVDSYFEFEARAELGVAF